MFEAIGEDLRAVLRVAQGRPVQPSAVSLDSRTVPSSPESGQRAGDEGAKRKQGSKGHIAVDTLGQWLALRVTAANEQDRAQVAALVEQVQEVTGETVEMAFVDQAYTGEQAAQEAVPHGITLEVVKLPMPGPVIWEGRRLPASYANFYIANNCVLVPTFADSNDEQALSILRECFPTRRVIGIDCRELIWGLGTFHCLTQQQPAV